MESSKNGKRLTLTEILSVDDIEVEAVECPEWGGTVFVRTLDADRFDRWEDEYKTRAALVALSLCDEEGNYEEVTPNQMTALGKRGIHAIERCVRVCCRISKIGSAKLAELEAMLKKTLASGSGGESG